MERTGTIVVGIDGSSDSHAAATWAVRQAREAGLSVQLVHSALRPRFEEPEVLLRDELAEADAVLEDAMDRIGRFAGVPISAQTLDGVGLSPTDALVAASKGAVMLVVGATGHGGFRGLLLGSVSQHVSRHASCPVVIVRDAADPTSRRIVVGVDGSEHSTAALEFALTQLAGSGAEVVVIQTWRAASLHGKFESLPLPDDAEQRQQRYQQQLETLVAPWREKFPEVHLSAEAVPGHTVPVLTDASTHASLVVVGAAGRGAFASLLLGSVSQSVLHHAASPVVIVR